MKKKFLIIAMLLITLFGFTACGKSKLNLYDYVIEERDALFTACDELYSVSLSFGKRESDYDFDGIVNDKVDFAILTLNRNNNQTLANDTYTYEVSFGENLHNGFLTKNETNNSYSADLEIAMPTDVEINVKISFTGYCFNKTLSETSSKFNIDKNTAINIANNELIENVNNLLEDKNVKIEVVIKLIKDFSHSDVENYYWYVGVVSTNGNTLGILIDANNGDIIAKKV